MALWALNTEEDGSGGWAWLDWKKNVWEVWTIPTIWETSLSWRKEAIEDKVGTPLFWIDLVPRVPILDGLPGEHEPMGIPSKEIRLMDKMKDAKEFIEILKKCTETGYDDPINLCNLQLRSEIPLEVRIAYVEAAGRILAAALGKDEK